ncbi:hypothetical protein JSE7799_01892 [Jannaschia seosinensis]|uniref:Hedgehog/Intein (Hint) domain-containing protein n=1 Tax=Jannaschia seosinensis TaxID=313367 RepID=A0A0M7B9X0_9RHOB|nr:Hint domain-containing protein [Jannaschia seosinensis]CUH39171.1 hypothetical protein JSE7799_01892 [Jannaschia seosinensis]
MTVQLRHRAEELTLLGATAVFPAEMAKPEMQGGIEAETLVLTARGEVPAEALCAGDRIVTRECGMAVLKSVGTVEGRGCHIRAGTLGRNRPARDTVVAADQQVTIRDWLAGSVSTGASAVVAAGELCEEKGGRAMHAHFVQLDFGAPLTVYANGVEMQTGRTETFPAKLLAAV